MKLSIVKHFYSKQDEIINPNYINLGELLVELKSKNIFTKLLNNNIRYVGNSLRKLTEFKEYLDNSIGNSVNALGFLRYTFIDNQLRFTVKYPFISLINIIGTNIDVTNLTDSYLQVKDIDLTVTNLTRPIFNLIDLGDVANLVLSEAVDNYTLTGNFNSNTNISSIKDVFTNRYYGNWILKPDAFKLQLLEDLYYRPETNTNYIVRKVKDGERGIPGTVVTEPFQINYDKNPRLDNNLNSNLYSIYNQFYKSVYYNLTESAEAINLDLFDYSMCTVYAPNTYYIIFSLSTSSDFTNQGFNSAIINLVDFKGAISFQGCIVEYENGTLPQLIGYTNCIQLTYFMENSGLLVRLAHKGIDLK